MMTRTCSTLIAFVVLSLSLGASANAQDAVQWRVEDGGNGHWYQEVLTGPITFWDARDQALQAGGDLASLSIEEEYSWMCEQGWSVTAWIGAYKPQGGSWGWVDGESWDYTAWHPCEPNNGAAELAIMCPLHCLPSQGCGSGGGWYDYRPVSKAPYVAGYLVEWSADCNGDGIVDYGQILDGTLVDGNGDGTPDCCEEGFCVPRMPGAHEWKIQNGGNGHWYAFHGLSESWDESREHAISLGGDLATITSQAEQDFIAPILPGPYGWSAFIGASDVDSEGDWTWVSGEPWGFNYWSVNEPNGDGDYVECGGGNKEQFPRWNDTTNNAGTRGLVLEWSADCNDDGIVDYGQILDGTLVDDDENGIPDCCEESDCPSVADLDGDGCVDGTDLSALLGAWGLDDPKVGDLDGDGTVRGSDLTILLSEWSPCP